jgi:hypothetical protein
MEIVGTGLFVVGLLIAIAGWVMVVVAAFRDSVGWGIGSLLIPLVALIFVITHWQDARRGFLTQVGGMAIFLFGAMITPTPKKPQPVEQKPVAAVEAPVTYASNTPIYNPTPKKKYVPPAPEPEQPTIAKVYADRATHLYYPSDCAKHPEDALMLAKSVAVMQGYKPAACR